MEQRADWYQKYIKLLENKDMILLNGKKEYLSKNINIYTYLPDTDMYKSSITMKSIQYLTDTSIIRIWKDDIFEKYLEEQKNEEKVYLI